MRSINCNIPNVSNSKLSTCGVCVRALKTGIDVRKSEKIIIIEGDQGNILFFIWFSWVRFILSAASNKHPNHIPPISPQIFSFFFVCVLSHNLEATEIFDFLIVGIVICCRTQPNYVLPFFFRIKLKLSFLRKLIICRYSIAFPILAIRKMNESKRPKPNG